MADKVKAGCELSIVVPVYNEQQNLQRLFEEIKKVVNTLQISWEIIFADDGSSDDSWATIQTLNRQNRVVKGVRLARNFGHQYALFAGLRHARGRAVVTMDGDLQHPPHLIAELVKEWHKGFAIVHTIRQDPADYSLLKKITSKIYYRIFTFCSGVNIQPGMADFRLLDRSVLDEVLQFKEAGLFLRGIVQWVGFNSTAVRYQATRRSEGKSGYSWKKMLRLGWDGISSFSVIPLRIATAVGLLTSVVAFSGILYAFYSKFVSGTAIPGWASSVAIISFLLGVLFILIGIIGEYVGRILIEVMNRPRYIIAEYCNDEGETLQTSAEVEWSQIESQPDHLA
ncbi:MAG: glycosyltransferase [Desulfobulbaceae bacterium]|nr:MAG: glycosyltransferase [Desulfobulbaceae bacterium]